jgi:hypothetical protein
VASFRVRYFSLLVVSFSAFGTAYCQLANPTTDQGIKPYASYHGGGIDNISLVSGALQLHIPVVSSFGRRRVQCR